MLKASRERFTSLLFNLISEKFKELQDGSKRSGIRRSSPHRSRQRRQYSGQCSESDARAKRTLCDARTQLWRTDLDQGRRFSGKRNRTEEPAAEYGGAPRHGSGVENER